VWDTPWLKTNDNWMMRNIIGNFTLSGTYTYESPQFATVQSGLDSNMNGDSAGDRAKFGLTVRFSRFPMAGLCSRCAGAHPPR